MKSVKNIIFLSIVAGVILAQIFYIFFFQKNMIRQIRDLQSQSELKQIELLGREKTLQELPVFKEELRKANVKKNAFKYRIPASTQSVKAFIEFIRLIESNPFSETKIEKLNETEYTSELGIFTEKSYRLNYIASYDATRQFIQNLNESYQLINVSSFKVDNSPQKNNTPRVLRMRYGNDIYKMVATQVEFSMFMRMEDDPQDETYTTLFNILNHPEEAFLNREGMEEADDLAQGGEEQTERGPVGAGSQRSEEVMEATFTLELWDALVSGDNYSFVGPGQNDTLYTGLKSSKNTYITLHVRNDGYSVVLEDEDGKVRQNSTFIRMNEPALKIISHILKIQETMPDVHIYIYNDSSQLVTVSLKGSLLDKIHVYNESEEKVLPGQTKGKVKFTS